MKKHVWLTLLLVSALSLVSFAQSKDEKAVADAVETFRKGLQDGDKNLLELIAADDLVYGHSSGKVQNKQEFVDEIVSNNPFDYVTVDITEQTIKISGNTAIVRHTLSAETKNPAGAAGKIYIGNMLVFQKQHGQWKLLGRQAYKK